MGKWQRVARRGLYLLALSSIAGGIFAEALPTALGAPEPKKAAEKKAEPKKAVADIPGPTDQEVLEAIRKGVNYLLAQKKGDNWETGVHIEGVNAVNTGGETALVLYALLHVGQSVQEDPELGPKLRFNSPELAPVVKYVSKIEPLGTYTAGLQASALTLVPKGTELGKESQVGLKNARDFLLQAMGVDGGYSYSLVGRGGNAKSGDFIGAWKTYIDARAANNKGGADKAKGALVEMAKQASNTFMGVRGHVEDIQNDIKTRLAEAIAKKDKASQQRAEAELRELGVVQNEMLRQRIVIDQVKQVADAEKRLAAAQEGARTGTLMKTVWEKTGSKKVPMSKEEIAKELEEAKDALERERFEARNNFRGIGDLSNGQYGTLGAWALMDAEIELPIEYWRVSDRFWRLTQRTDGCWGYEPSGRRPEATMGVAGIASLFLTSEQMDTQIRLDPRTDKELDKGLAWLDASFKPNSNGYYMYGVERVGLASGLKFFGTTNWYKTGAMTLLKSQGKEGQWNGDFIGANGNRGTAYALLFLARGRNPVLFNKLEYAGPWDARRGITPTSPCG